MKSIHYIHYFNFGTHFQSKKKCEKNIEKKAFNLFNGLAWGIEIYEFFNIWLRFSVFGKSLNFYMVECSASAVCEKCSYGHSLITFSSKLSTVLLKYTQAKSILKQYWTFV